MLNKVIIIGNLTADPEVRYTPQGTAVCNLRIANNRKWKPKGSEEYKEEVIFVTAVVWAKRAENCGEFLHKGSPVLIEGRLQQRTWEKDGQKHSTIEILAENVQFLNRTKEGTAADENATAPADDPDQS